MGTPIDGNSHIVCCVWLTGTYPFPGLCHQPDAAPQPLAACLACGAPNGGPRLLVQTCRDSPKSLKCKNSMVAYSRRLLALSKDKESAESQNLAIQLTDFTIVFGEQSIINCQQRTRTHCEIRLLMQVEPRSGLLFLVVDGEKQHMDDNFLTHKTLLTNSYSQH